MQRILIIFFLLTISTSAIYANPQDTSHVKKVYAGKYNPVCVNSSAFLMKGTPSGGFFTDSTADCILNYFYPGVAGVGPHYVRYYYPCGDSCYIIDSTLIIVNPTPVVIATNDTIICINGGAFNLTAQTIPNKGTLTWSGDGVSGHYFIPEKAGPGMHEIYAFFTDSISCSYADTVFIFVDTVPIVQFTANLVVGRAPQRVNFTDNTPFHIISWDFGDPKSFSSNFSNSPTPSHTYIDSGTYDVSVNIITEGGCENSLVKPKYIHIFPEPMGIESDLQINPDFKIFPNPVTNYLNIELGKNIQNDLPIKISIINDLGQSFGEYLIGELQAKINTDLLKPGIYYLKLQFSKGTSIAKWIKD